MDKNEIMTRLYAATADVPGGTMGGGTKLAADRIVGALAMLSGPAIMAAIAEEAKSPRAGPLGEWMKTLPTRLAR